MSELSRPSRRLTWGITLAGLMMLTALFGCGIDPMDRLYEQIDSEDVQVRRSAVLTLANLDDQRTTLALIEVLEDDEELRDMAAVGLLKKGREQVTPDKPDPIIEGLSGLMNNVHHSQPVRARGAWILGEIGDREAIPALKTASGARLRNEDPATLVREQANIALEKLGHKDTGRAFEIPMGSLADQQLESLPMPEPIGVDDDDEAAT